MSETICVVTGCGQPAADGYFACTPHLTWKDQELDLDEWGHCTRCGSFVRNDDIWHENCSRTAELAELEREIGRAVIANYVVNNSIWSLDKDWSFTRATNDAMNILNKCLIVEGAIVGLIARWRQLHAEGDTK